ncbi:MAG: HP0495 family protein [Calditrichia bacterium]
MLKLDKDSGSYEMEYPCKWTYKVIGMDAFSMRQAITAVVADKQHSISVSNHSATGKYTSLNLELVVDDELQRTRYYTELKQHPDIKMVL